MDVDEKRVPTFIPFVEVDENGVEKRREKLRSVRSSRSSENVPPGQRISDTSISFQVDEYIDTLIDRVLFQLQRTKSPASEKDESSFRSPIDTPSVEKVTEAEVFYSPRSDAEDQQMTKTEMLSKQDEFKMGDGASGDSLEFTLKDLPIQEQPESPLKPVLSAELLAEINDTLNSILNLDGSSLSDDVHTDDPLDECDDVTDSILIEYTDAPLEEYIPCYDEYFREDEPKVLEASYPTDDISLKARIVETHQDTFSTLLQMSEKDGHEMEFSNAVPSTSFDISTDTKEEMYLRAGLSVLEDTSGTELRRSQKTPDVTQPDVIDTEQKTSDVNVSSDDEGSFIIIDYSDVKSELKKYAEFQERFNSSDTPKCEEIGPECVEMTHRIEGSSSAENLPAPKTKKGNRAPSFFRRAASAFRVWRSKSYTVKQTEEKEERPTIQLLADTLQGPVHLLNTTKLATPRLASPEPDLDFGEEHVPMKTVNMSNIDIEDAPEIVDLKAPTATSTGTRSFFSRLTGTRSLPRNAERLRAFFKKSYD